MTQRRTVSLDSFGLSGKAEHVPATVLGRKALGDSLTASFGLPPGQGFVPQLQEAPSASRNISRRARDYAAR